LIYAVAGYGVFNCVKGGVTRKRSVFKMELYFLAKIPINIVVLKFTRSYHSTERLDMA